MCLSFLVVSSGSCLISSSQFSFGERGMTAAGADEPTWEEVWPPIFEASHLARAPLPLPRPLILITFFPYWQCLILLFLFDSYPHDCLHYLFERKTNVSLTCHSCVKRECKISQAFCSLPTWQSATVRLFTRRLPQKRLSGPIRTTHARNLREIAKVQSGFLRVSCVWIFSENKVSVKDSAEFFTRWIVFLEKYSISPLRSTKRYSTNSQNPLFFGDSSLLVFVARFVLLLNCWSIQPTYWI